MSDEVLSQSEVESLLSALDARGAPAKAAEHKDKFTLDDVKRPERVGKQQVNALQTLHEGFGRNFGAALSTLLRSIVEVKLTRIDRRTYSEFIFSLENPTCLNLLRAAPLEGRWVLDVNPAILYPIIDRLLGGGKESTTVARRPLTEIELRLVTKITGIFVDELGQAWHNVLPLELSVVRVESNPQLVQIVPPNEAVVLIGYEIIVGESRGMMNLCIPYHSIEQVGDKLTANRGVSDNPAEDVHRASVELAVELARTSLTAEELIGLRVGDIITTDHNVSHPLRVEVAGTPAFLAHPGTHQGCKAIRVEEALGTDP